MEMTWKGTARISCSPVSAGGSAGRSWSKPEAWMDRSWNLATSCEREEQREGVDCGEQCYCMLLLRLAEAGELLPRASKCAHIAANVADRSGALTCAARMVALPDCLVMACTPVLLASSVLRELVSCGLQRAGCSSMSHAHVGLLQTCCPGWGCRLPPTPPPPLLRFNESYPNRYESESRCFCCSSAPRPICTAASPALFIFQLPHLYRGCWCRQVMHCVDVAAYIYAQEHEHSHKVQGHARVREGEPATPQC